MKWEYKICQCYSFSVEEDLTTWLNYLGQEGWELIAYDMKWSDEGLGRKDVKGIFKRKIK